jgi:hypothetical protein
VELFRRAAAAGAQILKVARPGTPGDGRAERAGAFLLTFDVGHILVSTDPASGCLVPVHLREPDEIPGGLVDASEEEPWWRILGCPLAHAEVAANSTTIRLGFVISKERTRTLALEIEGGLVRAAIDPAA